MLIDVVTIFPSLFDSIFSSGVIAKGIQSGRLQFQTHNLRDYTTDKHKTVDAIPFGGGTGLIFKIEPLVKALRAIEKPSLKTRSILLSPRGTVFSQVVAERLSTYEQLILFCGRYEGVDERFSTYVDEELSIGDYVLTGGEIPAMVIMDVVSRLVPGVIGDEAAPQQDSFTEAYKRGLEHPHYTRPRVFEGKEVPEVLATGHHKRIAAWRRKEALNITLQRRPDLLNPSDYADEKSGRDS